MDMIALFSYCINQYPKMFYHFEFRIAIFFFCVLISSFSLS